MKQASWPSERITGSLPLLSGFALLTLLLHRADASQLAVIALVLAVISTVFAMIEGSFQDNVTVWAVEKAARTGSVPGIFEPLRLWANRDIQRTYMTALLIAMLLYSFAILLAGLVSTLPSWVALVWSVLAFPLCYWVFDAPFICLVHFPIIGTSLLINR